MPASPICRLEGQRFGLLEVERYEKPRWICRCVCGQRLAVQTNQLRRGRSSAWSCGCRGKPILTRPADVEGAQWIPLTKGRFALVDLADFALVSARHWYAHCTGSKWYAAARFQGRFTYLHHFLLGRPVSPLEIDHVNGDGLDCRRANMRVATRQQQSANMRLQRRRASTFKGVRRHGATWLAIVSVNREPRRVRCESEIEAAKAYDRMAREAFGEFARLNGIADDAP